MKENQPEVFDRLDQAYTLWEEEMWRNRICREFFSMTTPGFVPYINETGYPTDGSHKTKELLLQSISKKDLSHFLPLARKKFPVSPHVENMEELVRTGTRTEELSVSGQWDSLHFPYYLAKWNTHSRRVYFIQEELALQLQATTFKGMTFRDVRPPFDSFCIALEQPLIVNGGKEIDFLLVGEFSKDCHAIYALSRKLAQWKPVDQNLRMKIDDAVSKKNLKRLMSVGKRELHPCGMTREYFESGISYFPISEEDLDTDMSVAFSTAISDLELAENEPVLQFYRIVLGLCFYLQSFTSGYPDLIKPVSVSRKIYAGGKDGPALILASDVCKVQSIARLSPEETQILRDQLAGRGGREVRAHFREGHWRRPKGQGHDPNAPKTVWIRPTLVRRDRLPEDTLPLGVGKVLL